MSFPIVFANIAPIILIAAVIVYAWIRRRNTASVELLIAAFFMMVWAISSFAELETSGFEQKVIWRNITQIGVFYVPAASLGFSLVYSGVLKRYRKVLMGIVFGVQTLSILLIFTDSLHSLMRREILLVQNEGYSVITVQSTVLGQIAISVNFICMAASLIVLAVHAVRTTKSLRKQVLVTIAGMLVAVVYSLIKVSSNERFWVFFPISAVFAIVCAALFWGIFKHDFLRVIPVARNEVFNIIEEGIIVASASGNILEANKAAINILLEQKSTMPMRSTQVYNYILNLIKSDYPEWFGALEECKERRFEIIRHINGTDRIFGGNMYVLNNGKQAIGTISVFRDITEHKAKSEKLKLRAEHDGFLNILNRQTFIENVERTLKDKNDEAALIFFDIDEFKVINDRFGHLAGDSVLKDICECVRQTIRVGDLIGRIGGEEFAVFLSGVKHSRVLEIAEAIRSSIESKKFCHNGQDICVTVSIGVVAGHGESFQHMYQLADELLYEAKQAGKNCVRDKVSVGAK